MTFLSNSQITRYSGSEIARQQYNFNQKTLYFLWFDPERKNNVVFMILRRVIITKAGQKHKVEAFCKTGTDES